MRSKLDKKEKEVIPLKTIRKNVETNVRAYNNTLTKEYIKSLTLEQLLPLTHPSDRPDFVREIERTEKAMDNGNS